MIHENAFLNWLYTSVGFAGVNRFLLLGGFVVLVVLVGNNVFRAIDNVAKEKTLIIIAHRLAAVRGCGTVYLLDGRNLYDPSAARRRLCVHWGRKVRCSPVVMEAARAPFPTYLAQLVCDAKT